MHRVLLIAKRDYLASVKSKAFIVGLVVAPIMFSGGFIGIGLMRKKPDLAERKIAVVDHTGKTAAAVVLAANDKNARDGFDKITGAQTTPKYVFEIMAPEPGREGEQRLGLSDRVRKRELYGFVEIGASALRPAKETTPPKPRPTVWTTTRMRAGSTRRVGGSPGRSPTASAARG
jgi:ABC-2 type transport system permease protein